jgi:uncharacterized membrane protein YcaP (DUF421 family)
VFFDSWSDVGRVVVLGGLSYVGLVVALRVSGKRTLAKLNAFDLVVTVAIGSTLATILLSSSVSLVDGLVAFAVLIGAQFAITQLSIRWRPARRVAKSDAALLLEDGHFCDEQLERNRVTRGEVRQAVRASGAGDLSTIAAVVLETDGTFSVVPRAQLGSGSALEDVRRAADDKGRT